MLTDQPPEGYDSSTPRQWSPDDEAHLVRRAQAGDAEARDALVLGHRAPVAALARRFTLPGSALADDLVQEGLLAVLEAVDRKDPDNGVRLWTYAYTAATEAMVALVGRQEGSMSVPGVTLRRAWRGSTRQSAGVASAVGTAMAAPVSILPSSDEEQGRPVPGTIREDALPAPDDGMGAPLFAGLSAGDLADALACLEPDRRQVITLLYGLDTGERRSYEQAAYIMSRSAKAVDRLRSKALGDLRRLLTAA